MGIENWLEGLFGAAPDPAATPATVAAPAGEPVSYPLTRADFAAAGVSDELTDKFFDAVNNACVEFSITTPLRSAHFLAQTAHESGRFRYVAEIWGPTPAQVGYEGRRDLGNDLPGAGGPGNGRRWCGHGLIEVTGYSNHLALSSHFGVPMDQIVAWLESPEGAARSAGYFWVTHGLNDLADKDDVVAVTRRVNGGCNGLSDRELELRAIERQQTLESINAGRV